VIGSGVTIAIGSGRRDRQEGPGGRPVGSCRLPVPRSRLPVTRVRTGEIGTHHTGDIGDTRLDLAGHLVGGSSDIDVRPYASIYRSVAFSRHRC
jgi:hypothetical protein